MTATSWKFLAAAADHGGPADVDVLHQLVARHAGLGGVFLKLIKVHDNHLESGDAVLSQRLHMFDVGPYGKDSAAIRG